MGAAESRRRATGATGALLIAVLLFSALIVEVTLMAPGPGEAGTTPTFVFTAAGDFGDPGSSDLVSLGMRARYANASFLLGLGDLGYTSDEQGWCESIRGEISNVLVIAGNHDTGESSGGDIHHYVLHCPFALGVSLTGGPAEGYGFEYYFDYPATNPLARFIMITPGVEGSASYDYSVGSEHYDWVVNAVAAARSAGIPWIVAGMHKQCITVGEKGGCDMGQAMFDKLVDLKVDLILEGHDHVYERSHQIAIQGTCDTVPSGGSFNPDCVVDDGADDLYPKDKGSVVVVQGTGGRSMYTVTIDGGDSELGYFHQVMGDNENTKGLSNGYGPVIYEVSANAISARTDFCPSGGTDANGRCPSTASSTFQDAFTITRSQGPVARLTTSPPWPGVNQVVSMDASASYDSRDPGAVLEVRWDFEGDGTWDTTWSTTMTAQHQYGAPGSYPVQIEVRTSDGLTDATSGQVVIDIQPPVTQSSLSGTQGNGGWYVSTVTVTLSASDDLSGVSSTEYVLDSASSQSYSTPVAVATDGAHGMNYHSTDRAGNAETALALTFKQDGFPPSTTHSLSGTLGNGSWYVSTVTVTLASSDDTSGVAGVQYRIDGGAQQTYTSPVDVSGNGTHRFDYFATDAAGNTEPTKQVTIRIGAGSAAPPDSTLSLEGVLGSNGWFASSVVATLSAVSESGGTPTIEYQLDGAPWGTYAGPFTIPDGRHLLKHFASEPGGASEIPKSRSIYVDSAPPTLDQISPGGVVRSSEVVVSWHSADAMSGIDRFEVSIDGGGFVTLGQNSSFTIRLADGAHNVKIKAIDVAGNPAMANLVFQVDTNIISPTGPFFGLPLYLLVASVLIGLAALARRRKRKEHRKR